MTPVESTSPPPAATAPTRPRLLSYTGRWGRAGRWLPADARLVVDVGCAFGYGTVALMASGPRNRTVIGVERDPTHLAAAARRFPWLTILEGDAADLPFSDDAVDAVTLLDVLEHVADPPAVVAEIHRILKPGGVLIASVPNHGLLAAVDSTNTYPALRRRFPSWLPMDSADDCDGREHRHYTLEQLRETLEPHFEIDRVARSGTGVTELVHLGLLVFSKGLLRRDGLYQALLPLHLLVYLVDDFVPAGRAAYHLSVRAVAR